jgi:hypothetical protein
VRWQVRTQNGQSEHGPDNKQSRSHGPLVTPTASVLAPRFAIGSVNTAEVAVAAVSAGSLIASLGTLPTSRCTALSPRSSPPPHFGHAYRNGVTSKCASQSDHLKDVGAPRSSGAARSYLVDPAPTSRGSAIIPSGAAAQGTSGNATMRERHLTRTQASGAAAQVSERRTERSRQ